MDPDENQTGQGQGLPPTPAQGGTDDQGQVGDQPQAPPQAEPEETPSPVPDVPEPGAPEEVPPPPPVAGGTPPPEEPPIS